MAPHAHGHDESVYRKSAAPAKVGHPEEELTVEEGKEDETVQSKQCGIYGSIKPLTRSLTSSNNNVRQA